ncbi:PucR family transcriptional regulator [Streptomyces bauhiniae]|uniref:PucR family transcriptional regulator n=1 Tax=Streptomyces bauhiniae TaxID=2340725 RepID=A0A4Z1D104_9ACTN|nr:helix-turn-helix domain-containing protein [Streptomyces bauhiniae]TGN75458.1 PucR family transcriptional regulator [Streptomyces bauhiniae]
MAARAGEGTHAPPPYDTAATWAEELLDQLRPAVRHPRRVIAWLARTVHATAGLEDADGRLLAGDRLPADTAVRADVATGRISAAALEDGGRHVHLVGIRHPGPGRAAGAVLTVARPEPFDRRAAEIVHRTAGVLGLLLREGELARSARRLRRASADLRLAILQLLMVEDVVSARRVAAGLWPGLLEQDTARVYVVEGTPAGRDALAEECADVTEGRALVVRCPAMDGHVIVVSPASAPGERLRTLVADRPDTYLGGSLHQRLARTATAYGQAVSALAVARFSPGRSAVYAERTHPERLLDPAALRTWSARTLRPLDTLPHHTRAELLATTRLGLDFTAVSAAKVLGVSRNTVRARMDRLQTLLDTDLTDLTTRTAVRLALLTEAAHGPYAPGTTPHTGPRFTDLLDSAALRDWARDLLGRLDGDGRDLRATLSAWIAAGANAERAAKQRGVHAQTVREHVRAAEPVLERQLLAGGSDLYEVVLAHLADGTLAAPEAAANGDQADAPVHG